MSKMTAVISLGFTFGAQFGLTFFAGKFAKKKTFSFPQILLAAIFSHFMLLINNVKVGSFARFYKQSVNKLVMVYTYTVDPALTDPPPTEFRLSHSANEYAI